ncbi:uncharacterized protein LOC126911028 [Spodoptera frugiperda]|uniref:Uncharacterized protein LOC126911028 n=1 Tax=Spodoptera frugiperda TaxID=7108 RepID=A0A9R0DR04_SPOFR|nr:uncharacterized protein LOC126911028 [Spodoptera frugiperda]
MERRKLLVNLGKTRRQCAIMNREDLLQLIDNNRETSSESPKRPFKEDESLQNISDGFFEKNAVLADEVIEHLIEDLDVSAMKTNEYQLTSQDKSPCTVYSRSVTPVHPQSDTQINCENFDIGHRDSPSKLSDNTPLPSEYNSFTSSPPRPLSELDQNICLLNSGRPSSMSLSNCQSYTSNTSDASSASSNPEIITSATFDFQKILSTPHGETSSFYYKRKLSVFNFTVFDMGLKKGICYMWPETIAKRGSNEVASCLYNFIQQSTDRGIKDIRLWSDNCGGQNRNRIVFLMYVYCSQKYSIDICHKFLEKGHTQQEDDSVHALIEKSSKRKFIFCPEEWYTLVRWCKTSGDAYEVIEITQDQILDFKMCLNDFKLTKNTDNENVKWNQVREIVVKAENHYAIFYKYDLNDEEPKRIDLVRKVTTRSHRGFNDPKKCYDEPIIITSAKYKDLISLCQQNLIPPWYHNFYKNLKHSSYTDGNETE